MLFQLSRWNSSLLSWNACVCACVFRPDRLKKQVNVEEEKRKTTDLKVKNGFTVWHWTRSTRRKKNLHSFWFCFQLVRAFCCCWLQRFLGQNWELCPTSTEPANTHTLNPNWQSMAERKLARILLIQTTHAVAWWTRIAGHNKRVQVTTKRDEQQKNRCLRKPQSIPEKASKNGFDFFWPLMCKNGFTFAHLKFDKVWKIWISNRKMVTFRTLSVELTAFFWLI